MILQHQHLQISRMPSDGCISGVWGGCTVDIMSKYQKGGMSTMVQVLCSIASLSGVTRRRRTAGEVVCRFCAESGRV